MTDKTIIELKNVTLLYPAIYVAHSSPFGDSRPKFATAFMTLNAADEIMLDNLGINPKTSARTGEIYYSASSGIAPVVNVKGDKYDEVIRAFNIADVRNISRDKLLRGANADIKFITFRYEHGDRSGIGLGLVSITINEPQKLINAAYELERMS